MKFFFDNPENIVETVASDVTVILLEPEDSMSIYRLLSDGSAVQPSGTAASLHLNIKGSHITVICTYHIIDDFLLIPSLLNFNNILSRTDTCL